MSYRKSLGMLVIALMVVLLALYACEESGGDVDGDNVSDGDAVVCTSHSQCEDGQFCTFNNGQYQCMTPCEVNADCYGIYPGGCCQSIGTANFCFPMYECGGTDGDNTTTDGDGSGECTPDTYECEDSGTVKRCRADSTWTTYKHCPEETCCSGGQCVAFDGEVGTCDLAPGCTCTPDSYRCRGLQEVQKCSSDCGEWVWYRDCADGSICIDGKCGANTEDGDEEVSEDGDQEEEVEECVPCNNGDNSCAGEDEYCFMEDGETEGCCRRYCNLIGGSCPSGYECDDGSCEPIEGYCISDKDCEQATSFCSKRLYTNDQGEVVMRPDGVCEEYCFNLGYMCPKNTYCDESELSENFGKCVSLGDCVSCADDAQCRSNPVLGSNYYCNVIEGQLTGCCMEMCGDNNPCASGLQCCDGRCGVNCGATECTKECGTGEICDPLYNECVLNCPPCDATSCCDRTTAPLCKPGCVCENPIMCGLLLKSCCQGSSCSAFIYGVYGFCI